MMTDNLTTSEQIAQDLLPEIIRYRDEVKRYRNECRKLLEAVREERGKITEPEIAKGWLTDAVPGFPEPNRTYDAGERAFVICHSDSDFAQFEAYRDTLLAAGYTRHAEFAEGKVFAVTLACRDAVVNLSFAESDHVLRAVVDPAENTALPPVLPRPEGDFPLLFRQEGNLFRKQDCGMSYIFRLTDGKFLIIDGGWDLPDISEELFVTLTRMSDRQPPEIAAWIFTHAHVDHIGAFCDFAKKHAEQVKLDAVIYSFPGEVRLAEMGDEFVRPYVRAFRKTIAMFGDVAVYKARTGQKYHFAGLTAEILFSFEDYKMPHPLHNFNDTSLVFRICTKGQKWLFLGDVSESGSPLLVERYGPLLKSDIVQVAHHGYPGGTDELYDAIAAPIVLWPAPLDAPWGPARYSDPAWSPVTRRMVEKYAKTVYVAGEGSVEKELPLS